MAKFLFKGATEIRATLGSKEVHLIPGHAHELDPENAYVKGLVKKGLLELVEEPAPKTETKAEAPKEK